MGRLKKGDEVAGYRIERVLGKGGMGTVYLAADSAGQRVAFKTLDIHEERSIKRFLREAELGEQLEHPNLVKVFAHGQLEDGTPYLAMEFVEGRPLDEIAKERGRLAPNILGEFLDQLADGLDVMHSRGLTHRDLKPANLMVDRQGLLRVMDLGLVRNPHETALTKTGSLVGTPWYMAPEQVSGEEVGPAADVFSTTLIVYILLTGRHPFRTGQEKDLIDYFKGLLVRSPHPWHRRALGGPLDLFFGKGLARKPAERFDSMGELARAFHAALEAQRGGGESVEQTLELPEPASSPEAPLPLSNPDGYPEVSATAPLDPAVPMPDSAGLPVVAPAAPTGRGRGGTLLLALAGLGLFLGSFLWSGAGKVVPVQSRHGFQLPGSRLLVIVTEGRAAPRLSGGDEVHRSEDGTVHAFRVPPTLQLLEVKSRGGKPLFGTSVESVEWKTPAILERRFAPEGDLEIRVAAPEIGALSLRTEDGRELGNASRDPGERRFRVPDPESDGVPALALLLQVGGKEFPWARLEGVRSAGEELRSFFGLLESGKVIQLMKQAGRGLDAPRRLLKRLDDLGWPEKLALCGQLISRALREAPPRDETRRAALRHLPSLAVLDGYFLAAAQDLQLSIEPPFLPALEEEDWAIVRATWTYGGRAPETVGCHRFVRGKDYFNFMDPPEQIGDEADPTNLLVNKMRDMDLPAPEDRSPEHWAEFYTYEWRARFFAALWVNDEGPFFLLDDPQIDRGALAEEIRSGQRLPVTPEKRGYSVRLPAGTLKDFGNRVHIEIRPYHYRDAVIRPFLVVHGFCFEPARPGVPVTHRAHPDPDDPRYIREYEAMVK